MTRLTLEYLGTYWEWRGDLFYMTHPDGRQARVYVDSIGETWVDVRVVPEGGYFHTERVESYRVYNGAADEARKLSARGFADRRAAHGSHRVRGRSI